MKKLIAFLLLCLSYTAIAQKNGVIIKTIKQVNRVSKEIYIYPKVIVLNRKTVSQRINNSLLDFLEIENGVFKKSIFENVWTKKKKDLMECILI